MKESGTSKTKGNASFANADHSTEELLKIFVGAGQNALKDSNKLFYGVFETENLLKINSSNSFLDCVEFIKDNDLEYMETRGMMPIFRKRENEEN